MWSIQVHVWNAGAKEVRFMTFTGEYQYGIDEKGRLVMPVKYRESLGKKCMLSKGPEAYLMIYPMEAWAKLEERLNALSAFNPRHQAFKRCFFSGSDECEIDKQGRTLIHQGFRNHAHLGKEVCVVGAGDHMEVWDKTAWENYRGSLGGEYAALAEEIFQ